MSKKETRYNLTKQQKEAIAEQIAGFFFDFWQNRNCNVNNQSSNSEEIGHCPKAEFSEELS